MSYSGREVWAGDYHGLLHTFSMNEGSLKSIAQFNVGHTSLVTGVHHSPGTLYTCSSDRTIKVDSLIHFNNNTVTTQIFAFTVHVAVHLFSDMWLMVRVAFWIGAGSPSMCASKDSVHAS